MARRCTILLTSWFLLLSCGAWAQEQRVFTKTVRTLQV